MELYTNFYKILLFMKMYLPSSFILRYVRAEMNVHAFMNELDQKDYWYPRKMKNCENLFTKSMESCPLVISHILAEFHPEMATYTTLHNHFSLMDYPNLLKLLLLGLWNCLLLTQSTLLFGETSPLNSDTELNIFGFNMLKISIILPQILQIPQIGTLCRAFSQISTHPWKAIWKKCQ